MIKKELQAIATGGRAAFCLAPGYADGMRGRFCRGTFFSFSQSWLSGDELVFLVPKGGKPRLAVDELLPHVESMSQTMFLKLDSEATSTGIALTKGEHVDASLNAEYADLVKLLDAAPWA